jgi:hypothetical protein
MRKQKVGLEKFQVSSFSFQMETGAAAEAGEFIAFGGMTDLALPVS